MISKIEVWGDSILRGVVLDPETRRYSRLKEASCVALSSRALGIPAENHARFGMTSEKDVYKRQTWYLCRQAHASLAARIR